MYKYILKNFSDLHPSRQQDSYNLVQSDSLFGVHQMNRNQTNFLPWISIALLFIGALLLVLQLVQFSRIRSAFPLGTTIANIPVGGLTREQAASRLVEAYGVPVEMRYQDAVIQIKPSTAGFDLDLEAMLASADQQRVKLPFWSAFWNYLWNQSSTTTNIPLSASISEDRLRTYLVTEISSRYDQPAEAAKPIPGTPSFEVGKSGNTLDIDRAVPLIEDALRSPTNRVVNLSFNKISPPRPTLQNLQILLQQIIDSSGFDGMTEVYLYDLQTNQELSFAYALGDTYPSEVAFTAASTMKIPIMISVMRRLDEPTPQEAANLMELMIVRSENDPADQLMQDYLDGNLGPLAVTEDLEALGLKNSFLAGYFYPGAPLLRRIQTPANQRADWTTFPDAYNQTTPVDMGMLLTDLYQCAQTGGGAFAAVFPGEISRSECQRMIAYLANNRIGVLIQAGLPEGTQIAHKHGWITESDGYIHSISDAGIVYTPAGNYVLVISMHRDAQLIWDDANRLFAEISMGIYNYYNLLAP